MRGSMCTDFAFQVAVARCHLEAVEFMFINGYIYFNRVDCVAAYFGYLAMLQLLEKYGYYWDDVANYAAAGGHVECIEWALDQELTIDESTCKYAAGFGQLETLQWLRLGGCPWDEDTTKYASTDEIYNWAKSNGCPVANGNPREKLTIEYDSLKEGFTRTQYNG
jgi:hypothetical protein